MKTGVGEEKEAGTNGVGGGGGDCCVIRFCLWTGVPTSIADRWVRAPGTRVGMRPAACFVLEDVDPPPPPPIHAITFLG